MAVLRFLATAAGCAAAAFAIGQFMENGVSRAQATPVDLPETFPEAPVLVAARVEAPPVPNIVFDRPQAPRDPARLAGIAAPRVARDCGLALSAEPRPGAMALLQVAAPCARDARLTLRHQGLTVTLLTDDEGRAETLFPALAKRAVFMAEANGASAVAAAEIADLAEWRRVALQSDGGEGLSLHALAPGARHGGEGHLSRDMPASASGAAVIVLGNPAAPLPRLVEIYSAPTGERAAVSVEIEVTEANCGRPVAAELLQSGDRGPAGTGIELTLPGCDAVGELLALQYPEPGMTVASR
jgi:hypothetical protein